MIAFVSNRDGNRETYTMSADGSSLRKLTHDSGDDDSPAWSPDGAQIAFVYRRFRNWDVCVMNADSSKVLRLTTSDREDPGPA